MMKPITGPEQICSADATFETLLRLHTETLLRCPGGAAALQRVDEQPGCLPDSWERLEAIADEINDAICGMHLWFGVGDDRMLKITEMGADYYGDVARDLDPEDLEQMFQPTPGERLLNHYLVPELQKNRELAELTADMLDRLQMGQIGPILARLIRTYTES